MQFLHVYVECEHFWRWVGENHEVLQTFAAWVGGVAGIVGIFVSIFAWKAAQASAESSRISADTARMSERAYVNMSHLPQASILPHPFSGQWP